MNHADLMSAILRAEGKPERSALECVKEALSDHFNDAGAPHIAERLNAVLSWIGESVDEF